MKWTTKSDLLWVLDKCPRGNDLHYLIQRHLTRSIPRPKARLPEYISNHSRHVQAFRDRGIDIDKAFLMSFGAGWDLLENLVHYAYGVNRQVVFDITPLARIELIDELSEILAQDPPEASLRRPFEPLGGNLKAGLLHKYGIDYRAPGDASKTDLESGAVDVIATSETLEHIPKDSLAKILRECRRIISPDGLVSMSVDYSDHYSHFDPSITPYNFLRFGSAEWNRHNMAAHFQNRMRHSDYVGLFKDAGFRIEEEKVKRPANWQDLLKRQPIAREFLIYETEDLAITGGYFVLAPDDRLSIGRGREAARATESKKVLAPRTD